MKPILYKDKYGNPYMYSFSKKKLCYLNEIVFDFVKLHISGLDLNSIIESIKSKCSPKELDRAKKQFLFFLNNSFLVDTEKHKLSLLTSDGIKNDISNVNVITFETTQKCGSVAKVRG